MELSLKNLILTGIGTAAYTYEKAEEMVGEMVKKGEITMKQGRQFNEELKRKYMDKKEEFRKAAPVNEESLKKILEAYNFATRQDIDELKSMIDKLADKMEK